jgi:hypothetical protein
MVLKMLILVEMGTYLDLDLVMGKCRLHVLNSNLEGYLVSPAVETALVSWTSWSSHKPKDLKIVDSNPCTI